MKLKLIFACFTTIPIRDVEVRVNFDVLQCSSDTWYDTG